MKDIKREMLQTFVAKKHQVLSANTVRNLLALLSMMWVQAQSRWLRLEKCPTPPTLLWMGIFRQPTFQNVANFLTLIDLLHPST